MNSEIKDVRDTIIDAAREVFARFGYRKTTMDEIASAVHKGKSSLYHYFKNKEEVFQAVVEKESRILEKEVVAAINNAPTPKDKIRAYAVIRMEALHKLANFYSAFKDEYLEQYSFIHDFREEIDRFEVSTIQKILEQGNEQGIFVVEDPALYAFAIVMAMKGLEYYWAMEQDTEKTKKNINTLLKVLFHGIMK